MSEEVMAEAIEIALMKATRPVVAQLVAEFHAEIQRITRAVQSATSLEQAQEFVLGYSLLPSGVPKCLICGSDLDRRHIRPTNYCDKPACKREQQRRNQAQWRANKRKPSPEPPADEVQPEPRDTLSLPEFAAFIRTPEATIRYWRHIGYGPKGFKLGRRVYYDAAQVRAWVAEQHAEQVG